MQKKTNRGGPLTTEYVDSPERLRNNDRFKTVSRYVGRYDAAFSRLPAIKALSASRGV
jgi:hypothetical protein